MTDELKPSDHGRWLITTQNSTHIWDLDRWTYTRLPGPNASGRFDYDGVAARISRVARWPKVGDFSMIFYDDPEQPLDMEQWRKSSRIVSIEPMEEETDDQPEHDPEAG